jgi:hypothetical protein
VEVVMRSLATVLAVLAAAAGCQGLADRSAKGPTLLTIRGQITLAPGTQVDGKLRLALTWYPGLYAGGGGGATDTCDQATFLGIVSQEIEYQPIFPVDYAFDVTAPPPRSAQGQDPEAPGAVGALGALVAYVDGNGNGALDPCRRGKPCPDRVLGASGSLVLGDTTEDHFDYVTYANQAFTDGDGGAGADATTVGPGFFVLRATFPAAGEPGSVLLPLPETRIDIELEDRPSVRAIACTELCDNIVLGFCAVDDAICEMPQWPATAACSTAFLDENGRSRNVTWTDVENCTITRNSYVVEGARELPDWWPCK